MEKKTIKSAYLCVCTTLHRHTSTASELGTSTAEHSGAPRNDNVKDFLMIC